MKPRDQKRKRGKEENSVPKYPLLQRTSVVSVSVSVFRVVSEGGVWHRRGKAVKNTFTVLVE